MVSGPGVYHVAIINSIATALTLYSDTITFSTFTGIQQSEVFSIQPSNKNSFSVYPNPAKTTATVSYTATGNYILKLTDMNGNILQTKTGVADNNKNTVQLDLGNYAKGIYFGIISNEQKQTQTLKL